MEQLDCVVIGAGVVGLASARALARAGREVLIVEGEAHIGSGTSARNSEVIHGGIYYPPDSLKTRLCIAGRRALYDFAQRTGVRVEKLGKLIVATADDEVAPLKALFQHGRDNGVENLALLDEAAVTALEPQVRCVAAIHSPESGILDSHAYMLALLADAEAHGATLALKTRVARGEVGARIALEMADGFRVAARLVVNAAGLGAQQFAATLAGFPRRHIPPLYYAKGNYFSLAGKAPFARLVYPMPVPGGAGLHYRIDLGGRGHFGPDVEWVERPSYDVDPARAAQFYAAVRRYWPGLPDGALSPDYAGIRPKLTAPGAPAADFRIDGPAEHGIAGLVHLFGIESPGLTSSLAIGDEVVRRAAQSAAAAN